MKRKIWMRITAIIILFIMITIDSSPIVYAMVNEENIVRGYNPFIEYLIDKRDGRFIIRTLEGIPEKVSDNNQKLLFERNNDPETSYTTFRVDGEDYIFGNAYSGLSTRIQEHFITSDGTLTVAQWDLGDLEIRQALELIEDPEHPNVGNVRIRYEVTNTGTTTRVVGNRIMLDTQLGSNDGTQFSVGTDIISTETELTGTDIPDFYRTSDDAIAPNIIGYGFMKGWGEESPEKVVFAHYNTLSESKWDVVLDNSLDFTTRDNVYEGADSAVAYYFAEETLNVGEMRVFETFYGIGDFSHYDSESDFAVVVNAPEELSLNIAKSGYTEQEIIVTATIDNSMETSENLTNVNVSLYTKESAFLPAEGEVLVKEIPLIEKGTIKSIEFTLKPVNQNQYTSEAVNITVTADNTPSGVSGYDYVLMPDISGEKPEITIEQVAPDTVYYKGYREFNITGLGFSMLSDKGRWELYLVDSKNEIIEIPDETVSIINNEQIKITLYEDSLSKDTAVGDYTFRLEHSDLGAIETPSSKAVTMSDDVRYKSRNYGVLYVEKDLDDKDEYFYTIGVAESKEELDTLKLTKDIVLDIIGDVRQMEDEHMNTIYRVVTTQEDAIINSVIQYAGEEIPLEIKKSGDLITMDGDGTLKIVGSNEFWWWSFYTYIADGDNYTIEEIIEEEDEEDEALTEINPEWVPGSEDADSDEQNIVIDFFNPINAIGAVVNTFYDGFNIEIKSVILLDEGASFGGSLELEIPFGAEIPEEESEDDLSEEEKEEAMYEAMQDLFLTDSEREAKYEAIEKHDTRVEMSNKIRALVLCDDGLSSKVNELIESSNATPAEKGRQILDIVLSSPELITTVISLITGEQEDDGDTKSVGISIDVKKVLFGRKYKDDFLYDSVRYIGLDAEGEILVTMPFGSKEDRESQQGIAASASINTIEGEYTFQADVDLEIVEAHAIVSVVKVNDDLLLDHIELSGGFKPGIPISPPVFISKVGGGVKNLQSVSDKEPITIIMILGLDVVPAMEGDFRAEVSKNGFSLYGEFEFKGGMKIFKEAYIDLQWVHPIYFSCGATVSLFDVIEGSASLFIGEIPVKGGGYKFYFEGKVSASIEIPEPIFLVGGMEIGSAELGVSTEKIWGDIEVIGIGVGITYVYGEGVSFSDGSEIFGLDQLTAVDLPENAIYEGEMDDGRLIVGGNIRKLGDSESAFVSLDGSLDDMYVFADASGSTYDFIADGQDSVIFELEFTGDTPELTLEDPNGAPVELIENVNYLIQNISPENSPSGEEMNYVYISVIQPITGTYTVTSNQSLEKGSMYEADALPELTSLEYSQIGEELEVTYTSIHSDDSLVSIFLVHEDGSEYAVASNLDGVSTTVNVTLPSSLPEGEYHLRASIAHPSYGFDDRVAEQTLKIIDMNKPSAVSNIQVNHVGNGLLNATWEHIDQGTDITYYMTVYNNQMTPLLGYTDLPIDELSTVFGNNYTGIDVDGNEVEYNMPFNQEYIVGVTPVRTITGADDMVSKHVGDEVHTDGFIKKQPNPAVLYLEYQDEYVFDGSTYYFDQKEVAIKLRSNQMVDTVVNVDGKYYLEVKADDEFVINLELEDGSHSVEFIAENEHMDVKKETIYFTIDTESPILQMDSPEISEIVTGGIVKVEGVVEGGSKLYINDTLMPVNADGSFSIDYNFDTDRINESITVKAVDIAGNTTLYNAELINGDIRPLVNIEIDETSLVGKTGSKDQIAVIGEDESGNKVLLNNEDLEFSFIKGDTLAGVSESGELTYYDAGETTIKASYALRNQYFLSDAAEVKIEIGMDAIVLLPEVASVDVGASLDLTVIAQTKYSESELPHTNITYSVVSGAGNISVSGNTITGVQPGTAVIKALYSDGTIQKEATSNITIRTNGSAGTGSGQVTIPTEDKTNDFLEAESVTIIDTVLTGIWENLVEQELNLEIISVRKIDEDYNTRISLYDIGVLEIPQGTILENDIFLSGIIRENELVGREEYIQNSDVYEFTFKRSGGQLNQKMTLRLKVDVDKVINPELLGVYVYNELFDKWQLVGGHVSDGEIIVMLEHLSKYAVLESKSNSPFMDINNHWATKYINSLKSLDVVEGSLSGGYRYFSPNEDITRVELAAMAVRVYESVSNISPLSEDEVDALPMYFKDGDDIPNWGVEYAKKAFEYGLIEGVERNGERYFEAKETASRAEAMTILSRAIGVEKTIPVSTEDLFTDSREIPTWAVTHINRLYQLRLVDGYSDGSVRSLQNITRAEIAKLMYYWIDLEVIERKPYED